MTFSNYVKGVSISFLNMPLLLKVFDDFIKDHNFRTLPEKSNFKPKQWSKKKDCE